MPLAVPICKPHTDERHPHGNTLCYGQGAYPNIIERRTTCFALLWLQY